MGKKKQSKSKGFISKGERPNVSSDTRKIVRSKTSDLDIMLNKLNLWKLGKNVTVTIDNPDQTQTNRRKIKVSGDVFFGKGRQASKIPEFSMKSNNEKDNKEVSA